MFSGPIKYLLMIKGHRKGKIIGEISHLFRSLVRMLHRNPQAGVGVPLRGDEAFQGIHC